MSHSEPYLFRFKKPVVAPRRAVQEEKYAYDQVADMMTVVENGKVIFAIDGAEERKTKKAEIEKGEDQKDGRIWR